jgi:hypothetical protein
MKNTTAMVLAAAMGTGCWANAATEPAVTVCMDSFADSSTVYRAQGEASKIFTEVGVKIAWLGGRACQAGDVIHIHLLGQTPREVKPGALAYARPYQGSYIEVFYDRVTSTAEPAALPHLLAHVLVHEITHLLQGVVRHSETGIMKANWNAGDLNRMSFHPLPFAPEDVQLIRLAMQNRSARIQAMAVAASTAHSR